MKKVPEVENAKALMAEAMKWSVMKWLREKKVVRKTADQANAALDQLSLEVKQSWPEGVKAAYQALATPSGTRSKKSNGLAPSEDATQAVAGSDALFAKKIKEADDEAYRARMLAEDAFDQAEKRLSTRIAREGCLKAIRAWELQEHAIEQSASFRA